MHGISPGHGLRALMVWMPVTYAVYAEEKANIHQFEMTIKFHQIGRMIQAIDLTDAHVKQLIF